MASIAAFVYFWSSAYEVSGGCATDTLYPSFFKMPATAFQPEPSANAPCTRTTFLIFVIVILLSSLSFSESCIKPRTRNGSYQEGARTLLKTRTTFVDSCFKCCVKNYSCEGEDGFS